jgi:hypothetical protein
VFVIEGVKEILDAAPYEWVVGGRLEVDQVLKRDNGADRRRFDGSFHLPKAARGRLVLGQSREAVFSGAALKEMEEQSSFQAATTSHQKLPRAIE